jgi:hypothetical protein
LANDPRVGNERCAKIKFQKINENLEEELEDEIDHEELPISNHSYLLNLFNHGFQVLIFFFL